MFELQAVYAMTSKTCKFCANWVMLVCVVVMCTLTSCSGGESSSQGVDKHYQQASAYLKSEQYRAAMIEAKNVIQKAPKEIKGHVLLAQIFNNLGTYDQAIRQLGQLGESIEKNSEYYLTLGEAYIGRGKFRTAVELLEKINIDDELKRRQKEMLLAKGFHGLGDIDSSEQKYLALSKASDTRETALNGLARLYVTNKKIEQLDPIVDSLQAIEPRSPETLVLLAQLAIRENNLNGAEDILADALASVPSTDIITPIRIQVLSLLSQVLTRQGRSSEALVYSRLLAEHFPNANTANAKHEDALKAFKEGNLGEAETLLKEALELAPGSERSSQLLGVVKYMQGDYQSANETLGSVWDAELSADEVTRVFAMSNLKMNRPQEVIDILKDSIDTQTNADIIGIYGFSLLSLGEEQKALTYMRKSVELNVDKVQLFILAANYFNGKLPAQKEDALALLEEAEAKKGTDHKVQSALLRQYLIVQNQKKAKTYLDSLLKQYPGSYHTHILAGKFYHHNQKFAEAERAYKKATNISSQKKSKQVEAEESLARLYFQNKNWAKSEKLFKDLAVRFPEKIGIYRALLSVMLKSQKENEALLEFKKFANTINSETKDKSSIVIAEYYLSVRNYEKVQSVLDDISKSTGVDSQYYKQLSSGRSYFIAVDALAKNNYSLARQEILAALQIQAKNIRFLMLLAEVEIRDEKSIEAQKVIAQIKELDKGKGLQLEGDYYYYKKQLNKAYQSYKRSWAELANDDTASRIYSIAKTLENHAQAETFLVQWLEVFPNSYRGLMAKGTHQLATGKLEESIKTLLQVYSIDASSPVLLNNLAWAKHETKSRDAIDFAKKAVELAPENAAVLDTYGVILMDTGRLDEALKVLEKASGLDKENKEISEHLASARKKSS